MDTLKAFSDALIKIADEAKSHPERMRSRQGENWCYAFGCRIIMV